ncbi:MAG: hypothetical protein IJ523_10750 [Succinivibrionaceae bacterium]|nr:hypothetical protein [Succinivibrionaceae bacterium]
MTAVFITGLLLAVTLLGRLTNSLLFARILKAQQTRTLPWIPLDYTAGAAVLILLSQILLGLGSFTPTLVLGALLLLVSFEITLVVFKEKGEYLGISYQYMLTVIFLGLATALVSIHHPGFWDDTSYHLIVSRDLARNGDLTPNLFLRYPFAPFNVDILFALCFFAADFNQEGAVYCCQALANAPLFLIVILLASGIHQFTRSVNCTLAGLLLFASLHRTSITVHTGYAYIDYTCALFALSAFYYLLVIRHHKSTALYCFLGFLLGIAAGCKYQTAAVAAAVLCGAMAYLLAHRQMRQGLALLASFAAFGVFWYVRNWIQDGNPVDPFLIDIFGSKVWQAEDFLSNARDIRFDHPRGIGAVVPHRLWALLAIWLLVFGRLIWMTTRYRARLLQELKVQDHVALGLTVYSLAWIELFPIPRYLLPAIGILIMYAVMTTHRYCRKISPIIVVPLLTLALVFRLTIPASNFWKNSQQQRELFQLASDLAGENDRLLTIDVEERNKFFFDGVTVGDLYGNARFRDFYQTGTSSIVGPDDLLEKMRHFRTSMALISSGALESGRIDEFKSRFHFIRSVPQKRGGHLMVPLAQLQACKWLPPHSMWMESSSMESNPALGSANDLDLTFAREGVSLRGCPHQSFGSFAITVQIAELTDWSELDGTLEIYDENGSIMLIRALAGFDVGYDQQGHRIRSVCIRDVPAEKLGKLARLRLKVAGENVEKIGFLSSQAALVAPEES